ncbi:MAG: lytic transglycosylase domain-containing protein [Actinomycetota bacterium]
MIKFARLAADHTSVSLLPAVLRRAGATATCLLVVVPLALALGPPAAAEDASSARAEARAAGAQVSALTADVQRAQAAYDAALAAVGQQVTGSVVAQTLRDDSRTAARHAQDEQTNTARALYMTGGPGALLSTLFAADDVNDLAARSVAVDRVLQAAQDTAVSAAVARGEADADAQAAARAADASVVTAELIGERAAAVESLVARAQQRLDRLSARARRMGEAEAAAAALARARAAAAAATAQSIGSVAAKVPPSAYFALYRAAAPTCPGMRWTLLAAVGQVESGHGRNNGPSSAGAVGPMQFLPGTFAIYAVDGDRDGRRDPWSPADAIFTAARFLCSNGAGSPDGVQRALLRYNNAQWYVDLVLGVQTRLEALAVEGTLPGA